MAVKTITIDMKAYELLAAEKLEGESFSKVIKRRLQPTRTARGLLDILPDCSVSEDAVEKMEEVVRSRSDSPLRSEIVDSGD